MSTFAELKQEVIDRGFDYIAPARIGTFVQRSYGTLCSARNWPFLEESVVGTAPLEISDLGKVLSVKNATNEYQPAGVNRQWLVSTYPNLTDTGTPEFWYLEDNTLKVFPVDEAAELEVRYRKRVAKLSDSDEPLIPDEWQYLIVDLAVVHCLKDDDEGEEARAQRAEVHQTIRDEMVPAFFNRNNQNAGFIERTGLPGDYLG